MHASLAEAAGRQELPDDYTDVTEGFLSSLKRRLKRKLLGNFKHAYVDVLSRQLRYRIETLQGRVVEDVSRYVANSQEDTLSVNVVLAPCS